MVQVAFTVVLVSPLCKAPRIRDESWGKSLLSSVERMPSRSCLQRVAQIRAIEAAFATVERERFLGPGPWPALRSGGYIRTPHIDAVYLYSRPFKKERATSRQPPRRLLCSRNRLGESATSCRRSKSGTHCRYRLGHFLKLRRDARQGTRPSLHRTRSDSLRCESRALRFP